MIEKKRRRRKRDDDFDEEEIVESRFGHLKEGVKKSIASISLCSVAIILVLATFQQAGPAGSVLFDALFGLLGWAYYLIPVITLALAILFISSHDIKFLSPSLISATILVITLMSIIDILFPEKAGIVGVGLGSIEAPFGKIAALVVVGTLALISLMIAFNIPLHLTRFKKEEKLDIKEPLVDNAQVSEEGLDNSTEKEVVKKTTFGEKLKKLKIAQHSISNTKSPHIKQAIATTQSYIPPPLSLLISTIERPQAGDLRANAHTIKRTFENFGIDVEMGEINIGPKVTRYTLKPAEGIKLTRITALNQDLSLSLAAHPLRIEAPIPGKSAVGIEIPNKTPAIVRLGSLLSYPEFTKSSPLTFIVGRDVNGEPISAAIDKMPHLLISGATGAGKSILVHSIITSLLFKNSPETVKFVMIDPKRVELSIYQGIPHLVAPVVTESKKSVNVFLWAVQEMENRYEKFLQAGSRDIASYNAQSKNVKMPYIMIIVDELADLMAAHGRDVESAIVRLAQMARATGIHLILATQRPSVEVITGLIKANMPARIALQVASQIDSRTILDMAGAEKLLGGGDMLLISPKFSKPKRIQGPFITEKEIRRVVDFIRENNTSPETLEKTIATPHATLVSQKPNFDAPAIQGGDDEDELFSEALGIVLESKKASASLLQRRLKVGYARAARLLDIMESHDAIGPGEGAKAREIYSDSPAFQKIKSIDITLASDNTAPLESESFDDEDYGKERSSSEYAVGEEVYDHEEHEESENKNAPNDSENNQNSNYA